ncbi:hypothetical protein NDL33_004511 [Vibrio parahaemolyticus]|nr:hypothetical protein [Vibrio parahaemolyticus]
MNKSLTVEQSMLDTIKSDKIVGLKADTLDLGMKALLEDQVVQDIPIFGLLVKSYGALTHVTETIFANKIHRFLANINELSLNERIFVIEEISNQKGGMREAGEVLITLLNRADDTHKPDLIAKLFVECALKTISVEKFLRLSNIVVNTYIDDLVKLKNIRNIFKFDDKIKSIYTACGLMQISTTKPAHYGGEYTIESLAEAMFDNGFKLEHDFTEEAELIATICFDVPRKQQTRSVFSILETANKQGV